MPSTSGITDYRDAEVAAVATVSWAGRTWRLSDRTLSTTEQIDPGLLENPTIEESISVDSADSGVSTSLAFVLPAVSVQTYIDAGYDLHDMTVELAVVWHRGGTLTHDWSARQIMAQGDAVGAQRGDPALPGGWIGCEVEDSPYRVQAPIIKRTWEVNATTWPEVATLDTDEGKFYPMVVGAPSISLYTSTPRNAPPALIVEHTAGSADTLLVSIGPCQASSVTVKPAGVAAATLAITYQLDGLGQLCAVVDVSGQSGAFRTAGSYVTQWDQGEAWTPFSTVANPVLVAAYLLTLGGADVDLASWVALGQSLRYSVAGYVDDPDTEAWEVARDLLETFAVTTRRSQKGWAPVIVDPYLADAFLVGYLRENEAWRRVSGWQSVNDDRVARVEVNMQRNPDVVIGAEKYPDGPLPHAWVRHLDRVSDSSHSIAWTWSETTAWGAARWLSRIQAMGWEATAWQVAAPFGLYQPGDWLQLTESDGTVSKVLVQRRTLTDGIWDYTLIRPAGVIP